jgi:hypothetical protein
MTLLDFIVENFYELDNKEKNMSELSSYEMKNLICENDL